MKIRWTRLLPAALLAELVPIVALVGLVALWGPEDPAAAEAFASRLGRWVGPIGGALATFLLAVWVARPLPAGHLLHGGLLGMLVALLDAGLLVAGAAEFEWLFVLSGLGRVVAGILGGAVARRRRAGSPPDIA